MKAPDNCSRQPRTDAQAAHHTCLVYRREQLVSYLLVELTLSDKMRSAIPLDSNCFCSAVKSPRRAARACPRFAQFPKSKCIEYGLPPRRRLFNIVRLNRLNCAKTVSILVGLAVRYRSDRRRKRSDFDFAP